MLEFVEWKYRTIYSLMELIIAYGIEQLTEIVLLAGA